jgi:hypothetical protein
MHAKCVDDLWLFDRSIHLCIFNRYGNIVYSAISMVVIIVIPCAVTSLCYVQIYRYVMKVRTQMLQNTVETTVRIAHVYSECVKYLWVIRPLSSHSSYPKWKIQKHAYNENGKLCRHYHALTVNIRRKFTWRLFQQRYNNETYPKDNNRWIRKRQCVKWIEWLEVLYRW